MSNDISSPVHSVPYSPTLEIVTPLSTRMMFWRARFLKDSSFLYHLPFLFWLIETCRPKAFVELGVGEGVSYFAACQAFDKLDTDVQCYGIDPWPDTQNGCIPETVIKYNAEQYEEFSHLLRADPREAVRRFPDGSIDLLHIDMEPDGSLLDTLTHDWTRKLSRRGVVLLHGVNTRFGEGQARAFLDRITGAYPTVTLQGGEGLMLVLYGVERHPRLSRLAELSPGMPGHTEVHRIFSRLGMTHQFEWAGRAESGKAATARHDLSATQNALDESESNRAELNAQLAELQDAHDARAAELDGLRDRVELERRDHAEAVAEARSERDALASVLEQERAQQQARLDELAAVTRLQEERERELATLTESRDAAYTELDGLRAALDEERRNHAEALASRDAELAETRRELSKTAAALAAEQAKLEAYSWKGLTPNERHELNEQKRAELTESRDAAHTELTNLRATLEQERHEHVAALASRDRALAETRQALEDKSAALAAECARLEARFHEIAQLTEMVEQRDQRIRDLEQELGETRAHRDAILSSTFWKLTAPARKTVDKIRTMRG